MGVKTYLKHYKSAIFDEAGKLLSQPLPMLSEELFSRFERFGDRLAYESVYFTRRKFLTVLGLRAILETQGNGAPSEAVLTKLESVIEDVCGEVCWALPAHVERRERDWPVTVDLFTCETGQTLSELSDRLRHKLPESVLQMVRENVERRILRPFLDREGGFWWEKSGHNWNAVCCGSIGSICLHLTGGREELLRPCLERVRASLPYYLAGFAGDGACLEGLGYYFYGMSYFVNFAQDLSAFTDGEADLWASAGENAEKIASFWSKCYFPDGGTVNFSDGHGRTLFEAGLALALKRRFPRMELPDFDLAAGLSDDECWRFVFRKMNLLEAEAYLARNGEPKTGLSAPFAHILPEAQWCVAASRNGVGFACKGGNNGEPHNHNDIGHFLYEAAGAELLADLGAGEYTARYFGPERYDILCNGSEGHSVPLVGGQPQLAGADRRCRDFEAGVHEGLCQVKLELAGAYGCQGLTSLCRTLTFSLTDGVLTVEDAAVGAPVTENLITYIRPILTPEHILLRSKTASARIRIEGVAPDRDVTVLALPHSDHAGRSVNVYSLRWEAAQGTSRYVIVPELP